MFQYFKKKKKKIGKASKMSYFFFKKNIFLAEIRKACHQLYQIIRFD